MKICSLTLYLNKASFQAYVWKEVRETFLSLFFFYLRHSKFDLQTSTYIFYKYTAPAKIKSAAFVTVS